MRELLRSKKFKVTLASIVATIAARKGFALDPDLTRDVVGLIIAWIVAQGFTDHGKAAAIINAANPQPPKQVNIQAVEQPK
jgi:hypothetical protein